MKVPRAVPIPLRSSAGFTLFEVLAAVGILGLLYTVLASAAMEGLRAEGESARRLQGSLLADHALSELEIELDQAVTPAVGHEEYEEDGFRVTVEVIPLEIPSELRPEVRPEPGSRRTPQRPRAFTVRRIDVRVAWTEGTRQLEVKRTSFGLDWENLAPLLQQLGQGEPDASGTTGGAR